MDSFFEKNFKRAQINDQLETGYSLLKHPKFLKRLKTLSNEAKDNINEETLELLEPYARYKKTSTTSLLV